MGGGCDPCVPDGVWPATSGTSRTLRGCRSGRITHLVKRPGRVPDMAVECLIEKRMPPGSGASAGWPPGGAQFLLALEEVQQLDLRMGSRLGIDGLQMGADAVGLDVELGRDLA